MWSFFIVRVFGLQCESFALDFGLQYEPFLLRVRFYSGNLRRNSVCIANLFALGLSLKKCKPKSRASENEQLTEEPSIAGAR